MIYWIGHLIVGKIREILVPYSLYLIHIIGDEHIDYYPFAVPPSPVLIAVLN